MLADILHKIASDENQNNESYYSVRPSMAGPERCIRQMVYQALGFAPSPLPGRTYHVFNDGHWHEELTADWLERSAFKVHSQQMHVNIPTSLDFLKERVCGVCGQTIPTGHMAGHIDWLFTDMLGVDRHCDHKAINHFTFQRFWGGEVPLDYITQCVLYLKGLQSDVPDINESNLLVKNKNTAAYLEYMIRYDATTDTATVFERTDSTGETIQMEEVIENITAESDRKFAAVEDYRKRKTLPKRQYGMDHWRCEYCQFHQTCWESYAEEYQDMQTDASLDEMADTIRYKNETAAHRLEMEKEEKKLKQHIMDYMRQIGIRQGRAGEYTCELKLIQGEKVDKAKVPLGAKVPYQYEKLVIKKLKEAS